MKLYERLHGAGRDRGSAMLITVIVMMVLTGIGAVMFNIGLNNLQNSGRDRLGAGALGAAEAGVAQAIAFIRESGVGSLTCTGVTGTACGNEWGYNCTVAACTTPVTTAGVKWHNECVPKASLPCATGNRQFWVWVERTQALTASNRTGTFTIHSIGTAGNGPGLRSIDQTVLVTPLQFPIGLFGTNSIVSNGNTTVRKESMFSTGCIFNRDTVDFDTSNPDPAFPNLIPAAHSTQYISKAQPGGNLLNLPDNCQSSVGVSNSRNEHAGGVVCQTDTSYGPAISPGQPSEVIYDQDAEGGAVTGTACAGKVPNNTSLFTTADMKLYGYGPPKGLTPTEYALLKAKAQGQGTYFDCSGTTPVPSSASCNNGSLGDITPHPTSASPANLVVYVKLGAGGSLNILSNTITGYEPSTCGSRSVVVVVEGQGVTLKVPSNTTYVGSAFVPDGTAEMGGGSEIVGTVYAKDLRFTGSGGKYGLEPQAGGGDCFFTNFPLIKVAPGVFRELDR